MTAAWEAYNSEDSWLPLILPLTIWIGCCVYCYMPSSSERPTFYKWTALHTVHNVGAIILGAISIYFNDDAIFNERNAILWSMGYFGIDLFECIYRRDVEYTLHAVFCLILGASNYLSPVCRILRMNSKAAFCEISSSFLHLSKQTRKPIHFALFALVYTFCRILWIPYLIYELRLYGLEWWDFRVVCVLGFYALNVHWYRKIWRILLEGMRGKTAKKDE